MPSEKEISRLIGVRLDVSPFLVGAKPEIEVKGGVAILTGTVLDAKQKAEAEMLARKEGVEKVENHLKIEPPVFDSLMAIQSASAYNSRLLPDVKSALLQHAWLDVTGVTVVAAKGREGIIHLMGTVPDEKHKAAAEEAVNAVPGTKYAVNELTVGELAEVGNIVPDKETKADPKACSSLMEKYMVASRNLIIINDVQTALLSHPVLDASNVSVILASGCEVGIYRLEGTVPSEGHKQIAHAVASAVKGVQFIENKLLVG